jgi:hypothetical protein
MCAERMKCIQPDLSNLTIEQLNDLLVERTVHLLKLLNDKNTDGIEYRTSNCRLKIFRKSLGPRRHQYKRKAIKSLHT